MGPTEFDTFLITVLGDTRRVKDLRSRLLESGVPGVLTWSHMVIQGGTGGCL